MATNNDTVISKKQKNLAVAAAAALGFCPAVLLSASSTSPMTEGFFYFAAYILAVVSGGNLLTKKYGGGEKEELEQRKQHLAQMATGYNETVASMIAQYKEEKQLMLFGSKHDLKAKYSRQYEKLAEQFNSEKHRYLRDRDQAASSFREMRSFWGWLMVITLCSAFVTCTSSIATTDQPATTAQRMVSENQETTYWNAENIPIPYLQDSTQYVSNPDGVLTPDAVNRVNVTMRQIEDQFDVQSVVIVVNHIENDDPYRMAQDVGNNYGVGRNDRGLVVVVGYEDHSINISPGRSLEGDLTDAECRQLQQTYVIPCMKLEMPDSAMIYLSEALYATLQKKEMPQMALFNSASDDDFGAGLGLYSCFLLLWVIFFAYKNKKYQWLGTATAAALMANPFMEAPRTSGVFVGGGGGFRGGGFGGGGFGGGSFGGGSFGGGGATSRW